MFLAAGNKRNLVPMLLSDHNITLYGTISIYLFNYVSQVKYVYNV